MNEYKKIKKTNIIYLLVIIIFIGVGIFYLCSNMMLNKNIKKIKSINNIQMTTRVDEGQFEVEDKKIYYKYSAAFSKKEKGVINDLYMRSTKYTYGERTFDVGIQKLYREDKKEIMKLDSFKIGEREYFVEEERNYIAIYTFIDENFYYFVVTETNYYLDKIEDLTDEDLAIIKPFLDIRIK